MNTVTADFDAQAGATDSESETVRQVSFEVDGPVELDLANMAGRIEVRLVGEPGVHVELRHDPDAAGPWMTGLSDLFNWVSQFGNPSGQYAPAEAVRQTRIDMTGARLLVRTPQAGPLRMAPIKMAVTAPHGSHIEVRSASADVTVTGAAGRVQVTTGTGDVVVDRADGNAVVTSGSGALRLGPMLGGLRAKSGSGDVEVSSIGATATLVTSSGDVWLGAVQNDVMVRTGSGDLTVADAAAGRVELLTGSGEIRVAIRSGVAAEIDLSSGAGQARSELAIDSQPPATEPPLRVRGRTGSGDAVITTTVG